MNRFRKISELTQQDHFFIHRYRKLNPQSLKNPKSRITILPPIQFLREYETKTPNDENPAFWPKVVSLFTEKQKLEFTETLAKRSLVENVENLKNEILNESCDIERVLDEKGVDLLSKYSDGAACVELMNQLKQFPVLAIEVLNWRRRHCDSVWPMTPEEYSKGIILAGRSNNMDLAIKLFEEASKKKLKSTSLYNALMSAYLCNGLAMKGQALYKKLEGDPECTPSIVTYNILISSFSRLLLVDHMEATFKEILDRKLTPTIHTFRALISGYVTAWMWEEMERTYLIMKAGPIKPNRDIHFLLLRGYAYSGKLEKMEQIYEKVKDHLDHKEVPLIRSMISAYCKSSHVDRVNRIEELLKRIPPSEYSSWLNVVLITLYAKEDLLEQMESSINEAFEHRTYVTTVGVMRCIISTYFKHNAVDRLADFMLRAENGGWRICRSLYHCKMVLYSAQKRLSEMEKVLDEMAKINMPLSKKTFWILYKTYQKWGERKKLEQVVGFMCKNGYGIPLDGGNS